MPTTFAAAPIDGQIFQFERENELDKQFVDDEQAEGQSTDLCRFFFSGTGCNKGARCQFRHARNDRLIVCKHWLRGLCKKGEYCEYLHEFDMSKMPECYFFSKFGECSNAECMYRHVDPDKKRNECPYYARGFCKHGPKCRLRHVKKEACHDYLAGFCKNGPDCVFGHARFEIPRIEDDEDGPGGIDRFGFGRPKGPMPIPKMPSAPEENVSDAPNLMYGGRMDSGSHQQDTGSRGNRGNGGTNPGGVGGVPEMMFVGGGGPPPNFGGTMGSLPVHPGNRAPGGMMGGGRGMNMGGNVGLGMPPPGHPGGMAGMPGGNGGPALDPFFSGVAGRGGGMQDANIIHNMGPIRNGPPRMDGMN